MQQITKTNLIKMSSKIRRLFIVQQNADWRQLDYYHALSFRASFVCFVWLVTANGFLSTYFSYYALTQYEELNMVYLFFLVLMLFYLAVASYLCLSLVSTR